MVDDAMNRTAIEVSVDAASWMHRLVAHYRARMAAAPPDLAAEVVRMLDLREPLQFFAYESERFDWQAILAVPSPLAPDGLVEARPVEPWAAIPAFEHALAHPLWAAPLPPPRDEFTVPTNEPDPTLRSAGLRAYSYLESIFRLMALWEPVKKPQATTFFQSISYPCLVLQHRGSLDAVPPESPVDEAFESARQNLENRRTWHPDPVASVERAADVHGAYIVPRIRVGKLADQSLNNLARLKLILPGVITHRTSFNGRRVLVTHNGLVALAEASPAETVYQLNLIAAAMLELGYACYVFRELDLAGLYEPRDGEDHGWGGRFSGSPRQEPGDRDSDAWGQPWLRTSEFEEILARATAIASRPYAVHLHNYLEAYTHLAGHEPDQSILFGWAILERWLHGVWTAHVSAGEGPKVETKLRRLHAAGHLEDGLHERLQAARSVRNRVMHGRGSATKAEAEKFLETVELAIAGHRLRGPARLTPAQQRFATLTTIDS